MNKKNLILRYFGLCILIIGIGLNVKMYLNKEWPTYLFYIICVIGIMQIIISFLFKKINLGWQIFWALLPFVIGFIFINFFVP